VKPPRFRPLGQKTKAQREAARPSAAARGYGTDWAKLRAEQPRTPCRGDGCGKPWKSGFHLDHKLARAKGGTDHPSNLQWMCHRCHSIKTATQDNPYNQRGPGGS
jgi:5-methylcytosine-specific restriction protein A